MCVDNMLVKECVIYFFVHINIFAKMETIKHDAAQCRFEVEVDGYTAYVKYRIVDGALDVVSTVVPREVGGRGIAGLLVEEAYRYADACGYERKATCSYAVAWLARPQ
jgi:predicted GNAT family acetyltransferase